LKIWPLVVESFIAGNCAIRCAAIDWAEKRQRLIN
jgi:hypothetical protein